MKHIKPVTEKYFGMPLSDCQSADEPYDKATKGEKARDGVFTTGRGTQGGGSQSTPQAAIMKRGSATPASSAPRNKQKLRG